MCAHLRAARAMGACVRAQVTQVVRMAADDAGVQRILARGLVTAVRRPSHLPHGCSSGGLTVQTNTHTQMNASHERGKHTRSHTQLQCTRTHAHAHRHVSAMHARTRTAVRGLDGVRDSNLGRGYPEYSHWAL
jgi:hypothetical protein